MKRYNQRRKDYPYYKVQVYDKSSLSWIDKQKAYITIKDAKDYIDKKGLHEVARIMVVDEKRRYALE